MASAKPGVYASQLKPVIVHQQLLEGAKFLRWEDDSSIPQTVTLKVDSKGYLLYWQTVNGDVDYLEMSFIRDTRCGRSARLPKDPKLREACIQFGGGGAAAAAADVLLEDRIISVVYGSDLVNLQWVNFVAANKEIAQLWTAEMFSCAVNTLSMNPSFYELLERAWTKLTVCHDSDDKIPVKSLLRLIAAHKDDRKRVEKALSTCKLLSSKPDFIDAKALTLPAFLKFFACLCPRQEIDQIFQELNPSSSKSKQPHLGIAQFVRLLNERQRDPRLNEILYPYANEGKAREFIQKYEPDASLAAKDQLSSAGLEAFLMSPDNSLIPWDKLDISQDMDQPLSHYFINSSHNTYLAGHQLTGKSSVEMYRQVLLTGCRCVELDCWDGKGADEEPTVTHGFTMCSEVSFRETMEAIAETAFKISDFPVILSFENHCSPKQQAKMVKLIKDFLGDRILAHPLDSHPLKSGTPLPSPDLLRGKFLIKNKKRHFNKSAKHGDAIAEEDIATDSATEDFGAGNDPEDAAGITEEDADEEEPEALLEISAMVNYMEPAPFYSFEYAAKKNVAYECCSISENSATNLLKEAPEDFVNFNKRQISRIYPKGTRVDSSNYMPQLFWNAGCQLVALNFQSLDLGLQLNLGMFHYQRRCGYLLKPEFMRRADRRFDPFSESTVDGIVASSVSVHVLSGYFLSDRRIGTYVEVEMYGLPADTVRKRFRTRVVPANGINPSYNQEPFVFKKVVLPQLATLRIAALEESGRLIGQRFLPVDSLRPGYRHVPLYTELMQPLPLATLFVCLTVSDYVSDVFAEFAAALTNPIQYLNEMDKHQQQLMVLTDDFEVPDKPQQQQHQSSRANTSISESEQRIDIVNANVQSTTAGNTERSPAKHRKLLRTSTLGPTDAPPSPPPLASTSTGAAGGASGSAELVGASANRGTSGLRRKFMSVYTKTPDSQQQQQQQLLQQQHEHADANSPGSFVARCLLSDSTCVQKPSLEDVKKDKKYQKLVQKCDKEYLAMLKRNQKAGPSLRAQQDSEARDQLESHARAEFELQRGHLAAQRDELQRALDSTGAQGEKSLHTIYSQEHSALKKAQEKQRNNEARQLAKQFKSMRGDSAKAELREARRECQQRQVAAAVGELQALDGLHKKRLRELREHMEGLRLAAEKEFDEITRQLNEEQLSRLVEISKSSVAPSASSVVNTRSGRQELA